jgi:predicted GTPase
VEEMEEYEHYIVQGMVVYAGVDYEQILRAAEGEADVLVWDGGNNDTPFVRSDLEIAVLDPLRPGHEMRYYPGEVNLRSAQVLVVNKVSMADPAAVECVLENVRSANPKAAVILADSTIRVDRPEVITGRSVLVVEDGPTTTHGGMAFGAGLVAAREHRAASIVDPRKYATGPIAEAYRAYPHMDRILPALGYYPEQLAALEETINRAECDAVVIGTPIDLRRFLKLNKPAARVTYELSERPGQPTLKELVTGFLRSRGRQAAR